MKQVLLAALLGVAIIAPAQAADLATLPRKAPPLVSPVTNWSGFYVGAVGGYAAQTGGVTDIKGGLFGGTLGYNYQVGTWVFGIETDAAWADIKQSAAIPPIASAETKVQSTGTVRGRVGVAFDTVLLYGTGGYAWADNRISATILGFEFRDTQLHSGWTVGAGVEWMFAPHWSVKAEYLYRDFESRNYFSDLVPGGVASGRLQVNSGQIGVNYHF